MRGFVVLFVMFAAFGTLSGCADKPIIGYNDIKIGINDSEVVQMKVSSPEFMNNGMIPKKFSCQGQDINPELEFSGVPDSTKSLALIMDDPDAPTGTWVHWVLFNIPNDTRMIAEDSVPEDAVQGLNSWPKNSYGGPCPPSGTHRYFFKLYALDSILGLDEGATKADVEQAMQGHIIEKAELIGLYKK
jgi:hypothetical protein